MRKRGRGSTAARQAGKDTRPQPQSPPGYTWLWPLLLVAATFAVYGRTCANRFLRYDDYSNIVENPYLHPLRLSGLLALWREQYNSLYVPLVYTSFALDYLLAGGRSWWVHLENVALHAAATLLVYCLLLRLLRGRPGNSRVAAVLGAALFALHPIQTEAVAWATGRKDLLAGVLSLVSLLLFIKAHDSDEDARSPARIKWASYAAATAAFTVSLLAKPVVTVPLAALAIEWFALRRPWRSSLLWLLPWFLIAGVWTMLTIGVQTLPPRALAALSPVWTRPFIATDAIAFYFRKLMLPIDLSPIYGRTPVSVVANPLNYIWLPVLVVAAVWLFRKRTVWAAAAAVTVAFVLPVSGLVPFVFQLNSTVADRYMYCGMLGVTLAAAAGVQSAATKWPRGSTALPWAAAAVLIACAGLSFRQAGFWANSQTLWSYAATVSPQSAIVHQNLGESCYEQQRYAEAFEQARIAGQLDPRSELAFNGAGLALMKMGRPSEAAQYFQKAVEANPGYADAHANMGNCMRALNRKDTAIEAYRVALEIKPSNLQAGIGLAVTLAETGHLQEALAAIKSCVDHNPNSALARRHYGTMLANAGQLQAACEQLKVSLQLDPSDREVRNLLARVEADSAKAREK